MLFCFLWYCLCEIKNNCVRHRALHRRQRNDVTDRNAHELKQLAWTKHFTADTEPRKTTRARALRRMCQIFHLLFISLLFFYFRIFFVMTEYVWTDQYRIPRIFTSSYVGLDIKINLQPINHLCLLLIRDCGDMNSSLGRNGLIGLAVGASAAFGFIAFIIYREMKSRKAQRIMLQPRPASQLFDMTDRAALLRDTHDGQGEFSLSHHPSYCLWKIRVPLCMSDAN